jgi:hypothetical protein
MLWDPDNGTPQNRGLHGPIFFRPGPARPSLSPARPGSIQARPCPIQTWSPRPRVLGLEDPRGHVLKSLVLALVLGCMSLALALALELKSSSSPWPWGSSPRMSLEAWVHSPF